MTDLLAAAFHSQAVRHFLGGALGGLLTAAHLDYAAFVSWQSFKDVRDYNWGVASWRWLKGFVIGGVSSGMIGSYLG